MKIRVSNAFLALLFNAMNTKCLFLIASYRPERRFFSNECYDFPLTCASNIACPSLIFMRSKMVTNNNNINEISLVFDEIIYPVIKITDSIVGIET